MLKSNTFSVPCHVALAQADFIEFFYIILKCPEMIFVLNWRDSV